MLNNELEKFDLACTYLRNDQNIAAHNLFMSLAQKEMKNQNFKAGLYLLLASTCKVKQEKDPKKELLEAADFYIQMAKNDSHVANYSYRCAAKCHLKVGQYEEAMKIFEQAKKFVLKPTEEKRTIVAVDDSPAILMRLKSFLQYLGYDDIKTASNGKGALDMVTALIKSGQNPIVLLDMDLPDITGDAIATKLLESNPSLSIILITADEKAAPRVKKTIGIGSAAFVQKPFTINELKNALDTAKLNEIS